MTSPQGVASLLNPPHPFVYTDWVILIPISQTKYGITPETEKARYQELRHRALIHTIETRIGKGRCSYRFLADQTGQTNRPSQLTVTHLYGFHEVKHWPGASAQLEWTSFMFANIEYDDLLTHYGADLSITLPVLPIAAVPMFQAMKQDQDQKMARMCAETGKTIGQIVEGKVSLYATGHQPLTPMSDRTGADISALQSTPSRSVLDTPTPVRTYLARPEQSLSASKQTQRQTQTHGSQDVTITPHLLPQRIQNLLQNIYTPVHQQSPAVHKLRDDEIVQNRDQFLQAVQQHEEYTAKATTILHNLMVRCIWRLEGADAMSYNECYTLAEQHINAKAESYLQNWSRKFPWFNSSSSSSSQNGSGSGSGSEKWVERQFKCLLAAVRHHNPIAATAPPEVQGVMRRNQILRAMKRQKEFFDGWIADIRKLADHREGPRYRKEKAFALDLWTGTAARKVDGRWRVEVMDGTVEESEDLEDEDEREDADDMGGSSSMQIGEGSDDVQMAGMDHTA